MIPAFLSLQNISSQRAGSYITNRNYASQLDVEYIYDYEQWNKDHPRPKDPVEITFPNGEDGVLKKRQRREDSSKNMLGKRTVTKAPRQRYHLSHVSLTKGDIFQHPDSLSYDVSNPAMPFNYFYDDQKGEGQYVFLIEDDVIWPDHRVRCILIQKYLCIPELTSSPPNF